MSWWWTGPRSSLAAIASGLRDAIAVGGTVVVGAVIVETGGELRRDDAVRVERLSATRWRIGERPPIDIDEDGLPVLAGAQRRPLEVG